MSQRAYVKRHPKQLRGQVKKLVTDTRAVMELSFAHMVGNSVEQA